MFWVIHSNLLVMLACCELHSMVCTARMGVYNAVLGIKEARAPFYNSMTHTTSWHLAGQDSGSHQQVWYNVMTYEGHCTGRLRSQLCGQGKACWPTAHDTDISCGGYRGQRAEAQTAMDGCSESDFARLH